MHLCTGIVQPYGTICWNHLFRRQSKYSSPLYTSAARLCAALFFLRSISPNGLAAWPSRQAVLTPAAFGTKLGLNIAYLSRLGFLPKRVTRALGLAQDTGPGAFYFAFPPSRIQPRVQDLANMRPERSRRARRRFKTARAPRPDSGRRCEPCGRGMAHASASCFIASNHELFEQACAETYWESHQDTHCWR